MYILLNLLLVLIILGVIIFIKNKKDNYEDKIYNVRILMHYFLKILTILMFFTLLYMNLDYTHWNGIAKNNDNTILKKFLNRLYFSSITLSTVGYGDITAKSRINMFITILFNVFVILIILEFIQMNIVIKHI